MLTWAMRFLMAALAAALVGSVGPAGAVSGAVNMAFVICLGLCLALLGMTALSIGFRRKPPGDRRSRVGGRNAQGVVGQ